MTRTEDRIQRHYTVPGLTERILEALAADGCDTERLTVDDLAPVDGFHLRGRAATRELAELADLTSRHRVLDVGSGLGGTARYLTSRYGCRVIGVDTTEAYCDAATDLSRRLGLASRTEFRWGDACDLPLGDATIDVVWTEHVQMNVDDKLRFYAEIRRVLKPGGRLLFHDIFQGPGGAARFPVPWASQPALSHLATPRATWDLLDDLGFEVALWRDRTGAARTWITAAATGAQSATEIHLLMGATAPDKLRNLRRNLEEDRIRAVEAIAGKP